MQRAAESVLGFHVLAVMQWMRYYVYVHIVTAQRLVYMGLGRPYIPPSRLLSYSLPNTLTVRIKAAV